MSDTIAGPRLPPWEADTLGWMAALLSSTAHGLSAETVTGEDAILLRFPSGGERYVYLDDRPHGEPFHASRARLEKVERELEDAERAADKAEDERDEAEDEAEKARAKLDDASYVISEARALLASIRWDEDRSNAPEFMRDLERSPRAVVNEAVELLDDA